MSTKTEVFGNDCHLRVTNINMARYLLFASLVTVDGRKRCKNDCLDKKRFQEAKNGGFRKCISVDRT